MNKCDIKSILVQIVIYYLCFYPLLQAAARNGLNYLKMMTKKSVGGTAPSSGNAGGGSSNGK